MLVATMFSTPHEKALRRLVRRYQDAVLANPRDLGMRMKLAHAFQLLGRVSDATDELTVVAKLAARAGRGLEALATLQAILALDPHHTETQRLLAQLRRQPPPLPRPPRLRTPAWCAPPSKTTR